MPGKVTVEINPDMPFAPFKNEETESYNKFEWWINNDYPIYQVVADEFDCSLANIESLASRLIWRKRKEAIQAWAQKLIWQNKVDKVTQTHDNYFRTGEKAREIAETALDKINKHSDKILENIKDASPAQAIDMLSKIGRLMEFAQKTQLTAIGEASEIIKTEHSGQVEQIEITRGMPDRPDKPLYEENDEEN